MGDFDATAALSLRITSIGRLIATIDKLELTEIVDNEVNPDAADNKVEVMLKALAFDVLHVKVFQPNGDMSSLMFSEELILEENIPARFLGADHYPIELDLGLVSARGNYSVLINKHVKADDTTEQVGELETVRRVVAPGAGVLSLLTEPTVSVVDADTKSVQNIQLKATLPADNGGADIKTVSFLFNSIDIDSSKSTAVYITYALTDDDRTNRFVTVTYNDGNNSDIAPVSSSAELKVKCFYSHGVDISVASNVVLVHKSDTPDTPELLTAVSGLANKIDISFKALAPFIKASVVLRDVEADDEDEYHKTDVADIEYSLFEKNAQGHYLVSINQFKGGDIDEEKVYEIAVILHSEDLAYTANQLDHFTVGGAGQLLTQSINSNILTAIPSTEAKREIERAGLELDAAAEANTYELTFTENHADLGADTDVISFYSVFKNNVLLSTEQVLYDGSDAEQTITFTTPLTLSDVIKLVLVKRGKRMQLSNVPFILNTADGASFTHRGLSYLTLLPETEEELSAEFRLSLEVDTIKPVIDDVLETKSNGIRTLLIKTSTPELPFGVEITEVEYTVDRLTDDPIVTFVETVTVTDNQVLEFHLMVEDDNANDLVIEDSDRLQVRMKYTLSDKRNTDTAVFVNSADSDFVEFFTPAVEIEINHSVDGAVTLANAKLGFMKVTADAPAPLPAGTRLDKYIVTYFSENGAQIDNPINVDPLANSDLEHVVDLNDTFNGSTTRFMYRNTFITATVQARFVNLSTGAVTLGAKEVSEPVLMNQNVTIIKDTVKIELDNVAEPKTITISADVDFGRMESDALNVFVVVPVLKTGTTEEEAYLLLTHEADTKRFEGSADQRDDIDYSNLIVYIITSGSNSLNVVTFP